MRDPFRSEAERPPLDESTASLLEDLLAAAVAVDRERARPVLQRAWSVATGGGSERLRGWLDDKVRGFADIRLESRLLGRFGEIDAAQGRHAEAEARQDELERAAQTLDGAERSACLAASARLAAARDRQRAAREALDAARRALGFIPAEDAARELAHAMIGVGVAVAEVDLIDAAVDLAGQGVTRTAGRGLARVALASGTAGSRSPAGLTARAERLAGPTDPVVAACRALGWARRGRPEDGLATLQPHLLGRHTPHREVLAAFESVVEVLLDEGRPLPAEALASEYARAVAAVPMARMGAHERAVALLEGLRPLCDAAAAGPRLEELAVAALRVARHLPQGEQARRLGRLALESYLLEVYLRGSRAAPVEAAEAAVRAAGVDGRLGTRMAQALDRVDSRSMSLSAELAPSSFLELLMGAAAGHADRPDHLRERVDALLETSRRHWRPWMWRAVLDLVGPGVDTARAMAAAQRSALLASRLRRPPAGPELVLARAMLALGDPVMAANLAGRALRPAGRSASGRPIDRLSGQVALFAIRTLRESGSVEEALARLESRTFPARPGSVELERAECLAALGRVAAARAAARAARDHERRDSSRAPADQAQRIDDLLRCLSFGDDVDGGG